MEKIKEIWNKFNDVEPEVTQIVDAEDARDVYAAFKIILPFIAVAELVNVIILFTVRGGFITPSRQVYLAMYLSLFAFSVAAYLFFFVHRDDAQARARLILNGQAVYVLFLCLWGTFITLYDQRVTENVSVYVTLVMAVAVLARLRPVQSVCIFGLSQMLLLVFFTRFQPEAVNNTGNYLNTTFMAITAIAIASTRYAYKADEIRARLIMTRQKEEIERINARLRYLVDTDELTGLSNRRVLDGPLPALYERCMREGISFTTLMIDIDDFKAFNDAHGHQMGDRCIREVAEVLRRAGQEFDDALIVRYGGEEFAFFTAGLTRQRAAKLADELCAHVRGLCLRDGKGLFYDAVRVSVGWHWGIPSADGRVAAEISRADHALYEAKKSGKNRSVQG